MKRKRFAAGGLIAVLSLAACGGHGSSIPNAGANYRSFDWGRSALNGATYNGPAQQGAIHINVIPRLRNAAGLLQYAAAVSDPSSPSYRQYITPADIAARFGASDEDYRAVASYFASSGLSIAGWPQHLSLHVSGPVQAMERAFGVKFGWFTKNGVRFIAPVGEPALSRVVPVTAVTNLVSYTTVRRHVIGAPPRAGNGFVAGYSPQQVRAAFDYSGAYNTSAGGHALDGTGITVGIIGTGPIDVNRSSWCGDADLAQLKALYGTSAANVCEVNVTADGVAAGLAQSGIPTASPATPNPNGTPSGGGVNYFPYSNSFATPPPVTSPSAPGCAGVVPLSSFGVPHSPNCNPEDLEAQLDTQQIATLAPGSSVHFYLAYNSNDCFVYFPNTCQAATPSPSPPAPTPGATATPAPLPNLGYPEEGIVEADGEIQQAIADNTADVISISYGGGEIDSENLGFSYNSAGNGFGPLEMAALAAEGVAVFVSTGDAGASECAQAAGPCVSYPASDPSVTAVGGVNAPIDEFGQLTGNITAWGNTNGGNGGTNASNWSGSGGGTSQIFAAPSWQQVALGASKRLQPDVSMVGDPNTGVTVFENANFGGGYGDVGGTSVAAPEMAAMWALVLQACKANVACTAGGPAGHPWRLGNAAPYFYSIYKGVNLTSRPAFVPTLPYAGVFYDVVYGENAMYAGAGKYVPGYPAGPGFDQVTGLGVPMAGHLIQGVTGQAVP